MQKNPYNNNNNDYYQNINQNQQQFYQNNLNNQFSYGQAGIYTQNLPINMNTNNMTNLNPSGLNATTLIHPSQK
jgi:hypothetical protein